MNRKEEPPFSWKDTWAIIIAAFTSLWVPFLIIIIGLIGAIMLFNIMFS